MVTRSMHVWQAWVGDSSLLHIAIIFRIAVTYVAKSKPSKMWLPQNEAQVMVNKQTLVVILVNMWKI